MHGLVREWSPSELGADGRPIGVGPVFKVTVQFVNPSRTGPRVRLPKMERASHRLVETIRVLVATGGLPKRRLSPIVLQQLRHRAVLDPLQLDAKRSELFVLQILERLIDLGLAALDHGAVPPLYKATSDGLATLIDWDDPSAECVFGLPTQREDLRQPVSR